MWQCIKSYKYRTRASYNVHVKHHKEGNGKLKNIDCSIVTGARKAGFSIQKLMISWDFDSGVYTEWCEKQKISSEQQL